MKSPARLEALERSGLLHKTDSERLEHLSYTACALLVADACQINALDGENQRTVTGYPPMLEWPVLPVELSGCRDVVLSGAPLVIPDVDAHPLMCRLPWATDWKGYLGVPLVFQEQIVGSICVLSERRRGWKGYEVTALEGIARLVCASLEGLHI